MRGFHLETLSRLSKFFMEDDFRNKIMNVKSEKELLSIIDDYEGVKVLKEGDNMKD
ncbi:PTS sugar transporter subunit IIA [Abyssisolibacter fermentans]|uniref:PTS sugar transporter subunit IIA n=1 Tax=Abyssisolibacter fermentans TaxID=1766203 RepID=UPI0012E37ACC|nr:PTS sugar transporter subunit IIA [Abyssisolibacter fermentans]